jgi:2-polyprenyl-3-methyl-5-hydroxy-6-metoxy-1,4-benzoquinol methylase
MPTPEVHAFVRAALPPPPLRVLEIGAGGGELAVELAAAGYDVLAIDPAGGPDGIRQVALHEVAEPPGSFGAAVAVVSLHHVEPLEASFRRLAELVRPGGTLAFDEIDVDRLDERAARWWLAHSGHEAAPDELIAGMREHHSLARLREELGEWFALGEPVRGAYMHRWNLPPGLREEEEQLIAAGELPAFGARLVGVRRP